jgi:Ca2+-binding RTX toxin-like protein
VPGSGTFPNNKQLDPTWFQLQPDNTLRLIGSYVEIIDFKNGDFGINLDNTVPTTALNLINGTESGDVLLGTTGADEIYGLGGDDDIDGNGGHDVIFGGAGDDVLATLDGNDVIDGGAGRDVIRSGAGKDILLGGDGENFLSAAEGDDFLEGGMDSDYLAGGAGIDTLFGGDGNDILWGDATLAPLDRNWTVSVTDNQPSVPGGKVISFSGSVFGGFVSGDDQGDLLDGGSGDDILFGGGGNDQLYGGEGQDDMEGEAGDDRLVGGAGDDALFGDSSADHTITGNDILIGGDGNDSIVGGLGNDHIEGGSGNDTIFGDLPFASPTGGNDYIDGGDGDDIIFAGAGDDTVIGGEGNNSINGEDGNDTLIGSSGIDNIIGGEGNDVIYGGGGADNIEGSAGDDVIHAGDGNDVNVQGNAGRDTIYGDGGDDILFGQADDDELYGGIGNDTLLGGTGDDTLYGEEDNDVLYGEADSDTLYGGSGNDTVWGGDGDDFLHGGTGNDLLTGGADNDTYRFEIGDGVDTIVEQGDTQGDTLEFGAGLDASNIFINREGNNLSITHGIDADDKLIIQNWFLGSANRLNGITFDDATAWTQAEMESNINNVPVPAADTVDVDEDEPTTLLAAALLANDSDPDHDSLNLTDVSNAVNGTVSLDANGDVVFTSAQDFNGTAFFDYTVRDSRNGVATQTVTVNVLPTNDAPISHPDISNVRLLSGDRAVIERPATTISNTEVTDTMVPPAVTRLSNNNIVAVWQGYDLNGAGVDVAYQLFDPAGNPLDSPQQANIGATNGAHGGVFPSVAALGNGGFMLMWHSDDLDFSVSRDEIIGQQFDASGHKVGNEFRVNTETTLFQEYPSVVSLSDGGLFAIWTSYDQSAGNFVIAGQRFDATGAATGGEINLGLPATDLYKSYDIAAFHIGGFVIATDSGNFYRYDAAGNLSGSHTYSNAPIPFQYGIKTISTTILENDRLVVSWIDEEVKAQIFDNAGNSLSATLIVSDNITILDSISITALDGGDFVISWLGSDPDNGNGQYAQRYNNDGLMIGDKIVIATGTEPFFESSTITGMADGGFFSVWTDRSNTPALSDDTLQARVYNAVDTANGLSFTVDVLGNDTDIDAGDGPVNFTLDSVTLQGTGGQVSIVNNKLLFTTNSDFSALAEGETAVFTVDYTMADIGGLPSSSTVTINITGGNDLPVVMNAVPDQIAFEDQLFSFSLPANIFTDPDKGDSLVLSASLADGSALPAWLAFDQQTLTFSSIPTIAEVGVIELAVTATDKGGLHTSDNFNLTINNTNDTPVITVNNLLTLAEGSSRGITTVQLQVTDEDDPANELVYTVTQGSQSGQLELIDNPGLVITTFTQEDIDNGRLIYVHDGSEPGNSGGSVGSAAAEINLSSLLTINGGDGSTGFIIKGIDPGDFSGTVSNIGDINSDGLDDVIVGAPSNGNGGPGKSYVVFGQAGGFTPELELSSLLPANGGNGSTGFVINGIHAADLNGWSVSGAGDVNGDGVDDIIIGAFRADVSGRSNTGQSYVIFGSLEGFAPELNLSSLLTANGGNGSTGFVINGIRSEDWSGRSVASAGDVNGDGLDDLIIGASNATPGSTGIPLSGQSYVLFGQAQGFDPEVELASLTAANGGDGSIGFILNGGDFFENSGISVTGAGDINGDGFDDIIVGTSPQTLFMGHAAGTSYVIFGRASGFAPELNLRTLKAAAGGDGSLGFVINGVDTGDQAGYTVASAGDINGDGLDDMLIGAPGADPNDISNAGESYVVFGQTGGFGAEVNLSALLAVNGGDGSAGFVINGIDISDNSGLAISPAGDVNGDGITDIIIGASNADPDGNVNAGESYVVYGRDNGFGPELNLSALFTDNGGNGSTGFVIKGINANNTSGSSLSGAGDINGDGFDDLIIGAPGANGGAGESYVLFGGSGAGFADDSFDFSVIDGGEDGVEPVTGTFLIDITPVNDAPVLLNPIGEIITDEDALLHFSVPSTTIVDPDHNDTLIFYSSLSDGSVLPAWLNFDSDTQTYTGTPADADVGSMELQLTATDTSGESVTDQFILKVNNVYNAITGDSGDNLLHGTAEDDRIDGGPGNDIIYGAGDDDMLLGGAGNDILNGGEGDDILAGGAGDDIVTGGIGNDIYLFGRGGGRDIIIEDTSQVTGGDILRFDPDISFADVAILRDKKDLHFIIKDTGDVIILQQWKQGKEGYPINVEFGDGSVLTGDDLNIRQKSGNAGDDTVRGSRFDDRLYGQDGNDIILAKDGDDIVDGGRGDDRLAGMGGGDTYQFTAGWGNDIIIENDTGIDNIDTVAFGSGLLPLDLMFHQSGNDLRVSQIGTTDNITIQDWFLGSEFQVEVFQTSDGATLLNTQIDQLIQAMAGFTADTGLDWSSAVQQQPEEAQQILAASWQ